MDPKVAEYLQANKMVCAEIKKAFNGELYSGYVKNTRVYNKTRLFLIKYDDGDEEEVQLDELQSLLIMESDEMPPTTKSSKRKRNSEYDPHELPAPLSKYVKASRCKTAAYKNC